jgi:deoxyribodipyrimidine photo-lyase
MFHKINTQLQEIGSSLLVQKRKNFDVWQSLLQEYDVKVFFQQRLRTCNTT